MAKRISSSQLKSKLRQIEHKQKQAINNYNRAVRQYNTEVRRAVFAYNTAVRKHNTNVVRNRQIIQRELNRLNSSHTSYQFFHTSITTMQQQYISVVSRYDEGTETTPAQDRILDIIEQEQAHSLVIANAVLNDVPPEEENTNTEISEKLAAVSIDLTNRWKGAIFSISPENPDAARHFCTSARELFTEFIELKAPDLSVFEYNPNAEKTERGNATRREKIKYMMRHINMDDCVADFADADIENILQLFHVLSDATHGAAGRYEYKKLIQVKQRVEQGISFLCALCA